MVLPMMPPKRDSHPLSLLIGSCLLHAVLVTTLWVLVFRFDVTIISGKIWAVIALAWPLWFLVLALASRRDLKNWGFAAIAGVLILSPIFPTLYAFVVWTIEGFAP